MKPSHHPSIRALGRGAQASRTIRAPGRGGVREGPMNLLVPTPSPFLLPAQLRTQKDLERESTVASSVPANQRTPSSKPSTLGKASGEVARPTSPGFAESRTAARHRADPTDPAAAPGSGGQTWQRPGSVATTCGRPPPGRAAPPPHALGKPTRPGGGSPCKPAGSPWRHSGHVIPTGRPAGERPLRIDEMEAGTPGRSPGSRRGPETAALP